MKIKQTYNIRYHKPNKNILGGFLADGPEGSCLGLNWKSSSINSLDVCSVSRNVLWESARSPIWAPSGCGKSNRDTRIRKDSRQISWTWINELLWMGCRLFKRSVVRLRMTAIIQEQIYDHISLRRKNPFIFASSILL